MLTLSALLMAGLLYAGPVKDRPAADLSNAAVTRAVQSYVRAEAVAIIHATYKPGQPGLVREITVTELANRGLVVPDYRTAGVTLAGFGVPKGGNSGSPSFDPVTRKYWWQ